MGGTQIALACERRHRIMLRITPHPFGDEYMLKLEGCLAGAWVPELAACWHSVAATTPGRRVRVDLSDVCHVDEAGRALMTTMYRAGVRFVATGFVMPEIVREISQSVDAAQRS
jgi:ABC-type transporter Mla MlaB component